MKHKLAINKIKIFKFKIKIKVNKHFNKIYKWLI